MSLFAAILLATAMATSAPQGGMHNKNHTHSNSMKTTHSSSMHSSSMHSDAMHSNAMHSNKQKSHATAKPTAKP